MKKLLLFLVFMGIYANAQIVNIPDTYLKTRLLNASASNYIASTQTPVYNTVDNTWSVSAYNAIDTNGDGEIQISEAQSIKWLNLNYASVFDIAGIEYFNNLQYLSANINNFQTINVAHLTDLKYFDCSNNQLLSLNISNLTNLQVLKCGNNHLSNINFSMLLNLIELDCSNLQLLNLDVSSLINLQSLSCGGNQLSSLNISTLSNLKELYCSNNQLSSLNVSMLSNLKKIYCLENQLTDLNVLGLMNLEYLNCSLNQLSSLNVSGIESLKYLDCSENHIINLNVSGLINLQNLICFNNELYSLNALGLNSLYSIECNNNNLTNLSVSGLNVLTELYCNDNQLTNIDLSGLNHLRILFCRNNTLSTLITSELIGLGVLDCSNNQIASLNVSNSPNLEGLFCDSNNLIELNIKNNNYCWCYLLFESGYEPNGSELRFSDNPNLQYICADEEDIAMVQQKIAQYGYTNCHVNTYCSFTPGGTFYTINGTNHYDENNNGCDAGDITFPNFKVNITNGTVSGSMIADTTGNYSIPVQAGAHTLTPQLENPTYFNVSPATASVIFPDQVSPFTQDYCMTANGTHHDLEVTVIPINVARPGFDANYKIIYKNKGTNTETATLNFNYDDAVLDFVSATTTPTTQNVGNLVWSLGTVAPFQSGEITITLNLNAPTETPALNAGDVLNYSAIINGAFTDETPIDNTFNLPQNVVNSYDPNDKTCLEGETISNSMIGEYVHYMIRFENTGTYPAQNIVVKDMIDTTKFDVSTLQMTKASHDCYTRINGNKVEFIFENINLPFNDANNDGYVVFKIKTLPTLTQNSSVSNTADIFFDYNFPITTNTATTNFANLTTQNVTKAQVSVYPNPAKNVINIKSDNEINSISIFDIQGRQVQTKIVGATETVLDISNLQQGNYLLKINTDKGVVSEKIVKE